MALKFRVHLDKVVANRSLSGQQDTWEIAWYNVSVIEGAIERQTQHLRKDPKRILQTVGVTS